MKKSIWILGLLLIAFTPVSFADMEFNDHSWGDKLGRGVLNMISSPIEIARTVNVQSKAEGPAYGWTVGIVQGLGRTLLRFGAGAIDTVTFPFDFPDEDKAPLLEPTYPWQKWDIEYL